MSFSTSPPISSVSRLVFHLTAPNVVQDIKAASVSASSILVAWRRPVPSNGRISHYVVTVKDGKTGETVSCSLSFFRQLQVTLKKTTFC